MKKRSIQKNEYKTLRCKNSTAVVILCGGVKTIAECTIYTLLKKCSDFSQR